MKLHINDYQWHDTAIKKIEIPRFVPGVQDKIVITVVWGNNGTENTVIFENVYWANLTLGFGIVVDEDCIDDADENTEDPDLLKITELWKKMNIDIKCKCYIIKTSSTGSNIKIIAQNFRIK